MAHSMADKPDERRTTATLHGPARASPRPPVAPSAAAPQPAPPARRWPPPPSLRWAPVVVAAGLYCWLTAGTAPFSAGADVAVAAMLVTALALAVVEAKTARPWRAATHGRGGPVGTLWPWWLAIGVLVGWELFNYFQGPRRSHPTVSSIYDHVSRLQWAKAVLVAAWLVLGRAIVASFANDRRRR